MRTEGWFGFGSCKLKSYPLPISLTTEDVLRKKARRVHVACAMELGATPECPEWSITARFEAAYGAGKEAPLTLALGKIPTTPVMKALLVDVDRPSSFDVDAHVDCGLW